MTVKIDEKDKNICKRKYESSLDDENKILNKDSSPKLKRKKVKILFNTEINDNIPVIIAHFSAGTTTKM